MYSVVVVLLARVNGGRLALSEETEDLRWYALDALPQLLFEPHLAMLADLATGRRATWV